MGAYFCIYVRMIGYSVFNRSTWADFTLMILFYWQLREIGDMAGMEMPALRQLF